ncbi:alpha-tectorin-like, partial [Tiliqua scincoides]|uniref:alpha-tectorin-like n=1 Tax=Tiliqua scincoides TaxID=71010 RepID=UPI0034627910
SDTLLYPYGPQYQDRSTPKADDGASPQISISEAFYFYGKKYHSLYVNNNGVVSFGQPVSQFTPDPFPLTDGRAFVAPFWADVDNRITGEVYYRQTQERQLLQRATADINAYFLDERFTATWVFVATWDQVAFYGSLSSKVNTFQAVLTSNGERSFVMLNYKDIQWISGQASGGDANTGLEGTPAQAGFNSGDAEHYFNIPGSWTPHIINITSTSNILDPGRWVFEVDVFVVPNGCAYKANFLPVSGIFWVDPTCEKRCQCMPDGRGVRCQAESCSVDEICHPAFQYHVCQPIRRASCQLLSGRHHTTFDGRLYHFRGNCTYVLSQMCAPSHNRSLEYYRVEVEMSGAAPGTSHIRRLHVAVHDQEIAIPANATGHVTIHGIKTLLPVALLGGKVRVRQSGFSVKVVTDWGMEVSYDGKQHVMVAIPVTYHNSTCGLCGTLNGNASDDFSTPNASLVTSVVWFATSWKAKDVEHQCGEISQLLACSPSEQAVYSSPQYCGFLKKSPGPFTACAQLLPPSGFVESCVYDLCESGGDQRVLCEILRVYTEQCQAANVTVGQWRSDAFCGG